MGSKSDERRFPSGDLFFKFKCLHNKLKYNFNEAASDAAGGFSSQLHKFFGFCGKEFSLLNFCLEIGSKD